jgi:hypothetical protein
MRSDQPSPDQPSPDPLAGAGRLILAGIGLISLIGEELLARLQQTAADVSPTATARPPQSSRLMNEMSRPAQNTLNEQLSRRGLVTHADLQALMKQVGDLEKQIDQIVTQRRLGG